MAVYFPSLKFLGVIRSSETVRQHRVLTTLIHGRAIHAALTTVSVITNLHRNLLPDGGDSGVIVDGDLVTDSLFLIAYLPAFELHILRRLELARRQLESATFLYGLLVHRAGAFTCVEVDVNHDIFPDSFYLGVLINSNLSTSSILIITNLPALKLLIRRSSKGIISQLISAAFLHGRRIHTPTATVSLIGNRHLDVLPDGLNSGVFLNSDFIACSVLSFAYLPGLELFVCRGGKTVIRNLVL